jgi:hypothetical protein
MATSWHVDGVGAPLYRGGGGSNSSQQVGDGFL